jgi:hypothetical protein
MGINKVLERLGFVRLRDFGLLLTPDRRVLTTRSILDDGFGGRVVGWADGDLATMELTPWGVDAPREPVTPPKPIPMMAKPVPAPSKPAPVPVAAPSKPIAVAPVAVPAPPKPIAVATAEPPAPAAEPEDEWEWEIAVARARAEEVDPPRPVAAAPKPAAPPPKKIPHTTAQWLTKEPLTNNHWKDDTAIRPMARLARISEQQLAAGAQPRTIIPVPTLPAAVDPRLVRPHDDVTRELAPAPRRFPRSTNQRIAATANDDYTSPTVTSLSARARR